MVRDHDYLGNPIILGFSNFRGVAHQSCNLNVSQQLVLPVYIDNSSYDMKFILPALARLQRGGVVDGAGIDGSFSYNIIPKSSEKLLLLEFKLQTIDNGKMCLNKIRFSDSYSFFPESLIQLIQIQKSKDFNSFPLLKHPFPDEEMYDSLMCKGIYPYEYYSSTLKLSEEKLPPITEFYDSLRDRQCTTADYEFTKMVWAKGGCKNDWD